MTTTTTTEERCPSCGETKPVGAFYPDRRAGGDGLQAWCFSCQRADCRRRYRERRIAEGKPVRSRKPADLAGAPPLDDAIRRAVAKGALAGRHATRGRSGDGQRVVIVPALLWAEAVAARMRLAAAAGISGGGE